METPPFSEEEKRSILAEMIKASDIGVDLLVDFVEKNHAADPDWDRMQIPNGRTIGACKSVAESIFHFHLAGPNLKRKASSEPSEPSPKRPAAGLPVEQHLRRLEPKRNPSGTALPATIFKPIIVDPPPKRRGRPPKQSRDGREKPPPQHILPNPNQTNLGTLQQIVPPPGHVERNLSVAPAPISSPPTPVTSDIVPKKRGRPPTAHKKIPVSSKKRAGRSTTDEQTNWEV